MISRKLFGPPGTGKTTKLLGYVKTFLKLGTPIDKIGYFAFTKKASEEARDRFLELRPNLTKKDISDFLFSLRNHGGFHENCIEKIFLFIKETFSVNHLEICGRFLRRGGIDINPIRSSQKKLFFKNFREFNQ